MIRFIFIFLSLLRLTNAGQDLHAYVEENLPRQGHVRQIDRNGQKYWIKMADPSKGWLSCFGKKIGSWFAPDVVLIPTVDCGADLLTTEADRLKECEKKQGNCSRLILQDKNWLLLSDVGANLETVVRYTPIDQRSALIIKGLHAINTLHQKRIVQGRASLKDLTQTSSGDIYFIDLAENPERSMSFEEACARDYINYFMTALPFIPEEYEQEFTQEYWAQIPQTVIPVINRTLDKVSWLGTIANWIDAFSGRDIRKFARAYRVLNTQRNLSR